MRTFFYLLAFMPWISNYAIASSGTEQVNLPGAGKVAATGNGTSSSSAIAGKVTCPEFGVLSEQLIHPPLLPRADAVPCVASKIPEINRDHRDDPNHPLDNDSNSVGHYATNVQDSAKTASAILEKCRLWSVRTSKRRADTTLEELRSKKNTNCSKMPGGREHDDSCLCLKNDFEILAVHWRLTLTNIPTFKLEEEILGVIDTSLRDRVRRLITKEILKKIFRLNKKETDYEEDLEVEQARTADPEYSSSSSFQISWDDSRRILQGARRQYMSRLKRGQRTQDSKVEEADILFQLKSECEGYWHTFKIKNPAAIGSGIVGETAGDGR
ncbi:hypothetical protein SISNIDRAFT_467088 [Sistotremastrum niveocremeum HHB9708]|uniref:Uncharacterized protein n=1 Tax=Sistotremastrum niveocremeum HHB9708 TaxID=1314777 RepID=A0A164TC27_9AGAM|nr:hypothetical protein SISNIDRAFT_467088 [Sistotremastrum niveocremeum HHB9708]